METKKVNEIENKKFNTLLESIKTQAKNLNETSKDKLNKNLSLKLSLDKFNKNFINHENIKRISIDNENQKISLNLYNGFIISIMSNIYDCDFDKIKSQLNGISEYIIFNRIVQSELNNNEKPFINGLIK